SCPREPPTSASTRSASLRRSSSSTSASSSGTGTGCQQPDRIASGRVFVLENRAVQALRRPHNWIQLGKFGVVGLSGYVIYIGIYAALLGIGAHWAAAIAFVASAGNNYWWNRHWTFAHAKGHFGYQGMRFFAVSA